MDVNSPPAEKMIPAAERLRRGSWNSGALSIRAIVVLLACACAAAPPRPCPSQLARELTPAEEVILQKLPRPEAAIVTHDLRTDVLWGGILDQKRSPPKEWSDYLVRNRGASADGETRALLLLQRRYWKSLADYGQSIERCKVNTGRYDGSWLVALRQRFGDRLKQYGAALKRAVGLAYFRASEACVASAKAELISAELDYRSALKDVLRDWVEFVRTTSVFSPTEKARLEERAETFAGALNKISAAQVIAADARGRARLEVEAEELPPDIAAALGGQDSLSRPFPLVRAIADLDQALR